MMTDECLEKWGDDVETKCVRHRDHGGVHIDAKGREWGYVPKGEW